jgi:hypothetical protein
MLAKQMHALLIGMVLFTTGIAQVKDLPVYENGLVYDPPTMARLKYAVDSLNLKYKQCSFNTTYYSVKQAIGHYIILDTGDIKAAFRDIQNGISYQAFKEKYPLAKIDSNNLFTESAEINFWKQNTLEYTNITADEYDDPLWVTANCVGVTESCHKRLKGKLGHWIFDYDDPEETSTYFKEKIRAIYLLTPPATHPLPESYARNIVYTDCLIDTNSTMFLENAISSRFYYLEEDEGGEPRKNSPKYDRFMKYVKQHTSKVLQKYQRTHKEESGQYNWDSVRHRYIQDSLSTRPFFKTLLNDAIAEALKGKYITGEDFEYFTTAYHSKEAALLMKRNKIVVGLCSRDNSPRRHIMEIGQMAAAVADWPVFIRAHLDIMNDFAERSFNSNYAQQERETYIRELEELDIDVTNLLIGTALHVSNGAKNHYFSSASRVGRAFAETKHRAAFEQKLLTMIADEQLDDYNRYLLQYLFLDYVYYLPKRTDRMSGLQLLIAANKRTPPYMRVKFDPERYSLSIMAGARARKHPYAELPEIGYFLLLL